MKDKHHLCIHAHFYQPPRENPWIEEIEPQESARPFHDWNEKIHLECYRPNAKARVLDEKGKIVDIVNNFKKINFNFGPTLMAWLETHHPETYRDILAADRVSREQHNGHGNAIAQVYNHMIMPLANERDKITQTGWGIEEFRYRFKRDPEAIWLAETACDEATLEVLAAAGMKYLILAPHQAHAFRPLGQEAWQEVLFGEIDPKKPYRLFLKKSPGKYIDVFFYDGPISKAMGFDDLLFDAKRFMHRIKGALAHGLHEPQLISAATDGETFGHHKPFGDRVLAYLLNVEAEKQHFTIVNYGEYLEKNPPTFEVKLKEGDDGQGTSWSCAHGVKRWKENCGCRGGGPGDWTQHWRKPLREALDWLRDEITKVYEAEAAKYFRNPWEARNDYIHVILERNEKNISRFFHRHAFQNPEKEGRVICLKLLEMQRHAMLMYTSCGWFFTELSGIETIQVIQYAARALQLAHEVSGVSLEESFLERLAKAKSNIPDFKDGRGVYEKFVVPNMINLHQVASFYAIHSLVDGTSSLKENISLYCYKIQVLHARKESFGDLVMSFGRLKVSSAVTGEERDLVYIAVQMGLYDFRCSVKLFSEAGELEDLENDFFGDLQSLHLVELMRKIDRAFGEKYFALKDLPRRERMKIIGNLTKEMIGKISEVHERLYDDNRRMSEIYRVLNLPIPEEIRYAAEHTLKKRLLNAVKELADYGFQPRKATALQRLMEDAKSFQVEVPVKEISGILSGELEKRAELLTEDLKLEIVTEALNIQKTAKKLKVELELGRSQEAIFYVIKRWAANPDLIPQEAYEASHVMVQLLAELEIDPEEFKSMMNLKTGK